MTYTDEMVVSTRCLHGTCKDCRERLTGKPCYYCRDPSGGVTFESIPHGDYREFILNEGRRPAVQPFDVLFGSKHRHTYEMVREMLRTKWSSVNYPFSRVCRVCTLTQQYPEVDITLLGLFYACSTITKTTVLDAMTSLCMLYGLQVSAKVSPKDVYFHFFLNHCATKRAVAESDQTGVSDFVTKVMHALTYDVPEIDAMANFISILPSDAYGQCKCNSAQKSLATISGRSNVTTEVKQEEEDDDGMCPFVPDGHESMNERVGWDNSYKWSHGKKPDEKDKDSNDETKVDCLSIFSDCTICNMLMDYRAYPDLNDMDELIQMRRKYMNVETAVTVVCTERQRTNKKFIDNMIKHYTNPQCKLNKLRFIYFYSLVKQPSSLMSGSAALHLFNELFCSKHSYLCPTYHLACFSDCLIKADSSQLKKTKRDTIQKWATKVIRRHTHTAMRMTGVRGGSIKGK